MCPAPVVSTRNALLEALDQGPGSGTMLVQLISRKTSGSIQLLNGSVYPTLKEMERECLVERIRRPEHVDWERRIPGISGKWFKITASGKKLARKTRKSILGLFQQERPEKEHERPRRRRNPPVTRAR